MEGRCADLTRKLLQLEAAKPPLLKWLRSVAIEAFLAHDAQKKKMVLMMLRRRKNDGQR